MVRADFPVQINSGFKLDRGKYTVQFARHLDSKDPNSPMLKSNELTITVVAPSTEVEKARSDLSINLKTSTPSFRVGAPVIVHIALMNKSGEDMPIAKNPSNEAAEECCYRIDVRRQDGKPAIYTRYGEEVREPHDVISRVLKTLHNNEQLEEDLPLNKIVDLSPGTYTVLLLRANPLHPATIIESNVLPIQIKASDQVR